MIFFANQYFLTNNSSKLLFNRASINKSQLSSVIIKETDISNMLKSLNVNENHVHDDISIRMLNLSHKSTLKPSKLLIKSCLQTGVFPDHWNKANILRIYKKDLISKWLKIIDQSRCSQLAAEYLSVSSLMTYLNTSKKKSFLSASIKSHPI